eukprot:NODE_2096_length_995_cov_503.346809.p1 GENE.NODE_2096_length_995_cov_503.346809~~NODE_2096_length_995_cov_503.346809.p1  ORF type:complete len:271 (-),score=58.43 NODE_2096_length_995_cov_503.346809:165-977(-)
MGAQAILAQTSVFVRASRLLAQAMAQAGAQFLSFNPAVSPALALGAGGGGPQPGAEELEEMRTKDPPLRHSWTIWEQIMQSDTKSAQYSDNTHRVASFSTIKGFWGHWNHIPQPSELFEGKKFVRERGDSKSIVDALMVFRENIRPEWEDTANLAGGHFLVQLRKHDSLSLGAIDEYWNNIVLGVIGGTIEPAEMITGVRLVDKLAPQIPRPSVRIEVWFSRFEDRTRVEELQHSLETCMQTRHDGTAPPKPPPYGKIDKKPHYRDNVKK